MARKEKLIEKAQKYILKGYLDKAIGEYRSALDLDPKDVSIRLRLGDLYVKTDRKDEAVAEYAEAAKANSQRGFYLKAIAVYKQVLKLDDANLDVHYRLADLYTKQRLNADAISEYGYLANALERLGKVDDALELVNKMVEIDPENTGIRLRLAEIYQKKGFDEDALREYSSIFNQMVEDGKLDRAEKIYTQLHESYPDNEDVLEKLADLFKLKGDTERYVAYSRKLMFKLQEDGDKERMRAVCEAILEAAPEDEAAIGVMEELGQAPPKKASGKKAAAGEAAADEAAADEAAAGEVAAGEVAAGEAAEDIADEAAEAVESAEAAGEAVAEDEEAQAEDVYEEIEVSLEGFDEDEDVPEVDAEVAAAGEATGGEPAAGDDDAIVDIDVPDIEEPLADVRAEAAPAEDALEENVEEDIIEEAAEAAAPDVPEAVEDVVEEVAAPDVPEAVEDVVEEAAAPEAPEAVEDVVEEAAAPDVPEAVEDVVEEAAAPEAPDAVEDLVEEAAAPEVSDPAGVEDADVSSELETAFAEALEAVEKAAEEVEEREDELPGEIEVETEEAAAGEAAAGEAAAGEAAAVEEAVADADVDGPEAAAAEDVVEAAAEAEAEAAGPEEALEEAVAAEAAEAAEDIEEIVEEVVAQDAVEAAEEVVDEATAVEAAVEEVSVEESYPEETDEDLAEAVEELMEKIEPEEHLLDQYPGTVTAEAAEGASAAEKPGDRGEEYVDLTAELGMAEALETLTESWEGAGSEETIAEFRNGMGKQLSREDTETHYNLGIAYMEMELYEEAANEFKIAIKDPGLEFDCYNRLGHCAREAGFVGDAVNYYRKGLKVEGRSEDEKKGMRYELALVHEAAGSAAEAAELFRAVYDHDPSYRDVAEKVAAHQATRPLVPLDDGMIEVELL